MSRYYLCIDSIRGLAAALLLTACSGGGDDTGATGGGCEGEPLSGSWTLDLHDWPGAGQGRSFDAPCVVQSNIAGADGWTLELACDDAGQSRPVTLRGSATIDVDLDDGAAVQAVHADVWMEGPVGPYAYSWIALYQGEPAIPALIGVDATSPEPSEGWLRGATLTMSPDGCASITGDCNVATPQRLDVSIDGIGEATVHGGTQGSLPGGATKIFAYAAHSYSREGIEPCIDDVTPQRFVDALIVRTR